MSRRRKRVEDSTVLIALSGDAAVSLTFRGNLFDLNAEERLLISDLTDIVAKFTHARLEAEKAAGA